MITLLTALAVLATAFALYAAFQMHVVTDMLAQWEAEPDGTDLVGRVTELAGICLAQNQTLAAADQALGAASAEIGRLREVCRAHGIDPQVQA